jgi:hypothetical protein
VHCERVERDPLCPLKLIAFLKIYGGEIRNLFYHVYAYLRYLMKLQGVQAIQLLMLRLSAKKFFSKNFRGAQAPKPPLNKPLEVILLV